MDISPDIGFIENSRSGVDIIQKQIHQLRLDDSRNRKWVDDTLAVYEKEGLRRIGPDVMGPHLVGRHGSFYFKIPYR